MVLHRTDWVDRVSFGRYSTVTEHLRFVSVATYRQSGGTVIFHGCAVLAVADDNDKGTAIFTRVVIAALDNCDSDTLCVFVYLAFCAILCNSVRPTTTNIPIVAVDHD